MSQLFEAFAVGLFTEIHYRVASALGWRRDVADHRERMKQRAALTPAWTAAVSRRRPRILEGEDRVARMPAAHLPDAILAAGIVANDTPVCWIGGAPHWGEGFLLDPIPKGTKIDVTIEPRRSDAGAVTLTYPEGTPGPIDWADEEDREIDRAYQITGSPIRDWERWGGNVDRLTDHEVAILDAVDAWRRAAGLAPYHGIPANCPILIGLI